jgi:general secretion pathway protein A
VLIVDEAHLLTVDLLEDLRLLSNADTHREKLLQIVLSGQPELLRLLAEPELGALAQRIAAFFTLRQLSLEECRTYITQRLRSAGYSGVFPLIAPEAVEQVHRLSKGVPRLVNLLCDRSLSMAANLRMKYVTPEVVLDGALKLSVLALQPKASAPPTPITGNGKPVMPAVQSKAGVAGAMHE